MPSDSACLQNDCAKGFLIRSEEHTSELQSRLHLVCRLLLEKKKHPIRSYEHRSAVKGQLQLGHRLLGEENRQALVLRRSDPAGPVNELNRSLNHGPPYPRSS